MRRTLSRSIVAASAILLLTLLTNAARRPRYGGQLVIDTRVALRSIDPTELANDPAEEAFKEMLLGQVFETLVRIDEHGQFQPWLATDWTHDPARKRWLFTPRAGVLLHNGVVWAPSDGAISVPDKKPIAEILEDLSRPANAVVLREPDGKLIGTGPFRIAHWDSGKMIRLEAYDEYWRGRPYLDAVEVRTVPGSRERLLNLEFAKTDVAEVQLTDIRRLRQQGVDVKMSKPVDVLALVFENQQVPVATREALALAIDRSIIQHVLLDRQAEISAALLPQWFSGYAFLFTIDRDLQRAKALARDAGPLTFAYNHDDSLIRSVAERIALNASETGLALRPATRAPDLQLRCLPLTARRPDMALEDDARLLGAPPFHATSPYEREQLLLKDFRVIPLFHLPVSFALRPSVRNWTIPWRLDEVWLEAATKP